MSIERPISITFVQNTIRVSGNAANHAGIFLKKIVWQYFKTIVLAENRASKRCPIMRRPKPV